MTALNTELLVANLGAYFRDVTKTRELMRNALIGMTSMFSYVELQDGIKDEVPLVNLTSTTLVQPGNSKTFNPKADAMSFVPRMLKVRGWKVDLQIDPSELWRTYLASMQQLKKGSDPLQLLFEDVILDEITKRISNDLRMRAIFKGVYNATGTAAGDIFNGFLKLIADEITATNITPLVTGAITSANAHAKVVALYDDLGEEYKAMENVVIVNPSIFDWVARTENPLFNSGILSTPEGLKAGAFAEAIPIRGTNALCVKEPGLGTSQRMICTQKGNLVYGVDLISDESTIRVQQNHRLLDLMVDGKGGVQIKNLNDGNTTVNDQV
jgi:hypothetical protein